MTDTITLVRLNGILNRAGFEDDEIISGVNFGRSGLQKIAAAIGARVSEVPDLLDALRSRLRDEQAHVTEAYEQVLEGARYGIEKDSLGNVTVRDTETGKETFLRGADAAELLNAVKAGDEQTILAGYVTESLDEAADDSGYEDEIKSDKGSYNFPWSYDGDTGTATADYSGVGDTFKVRLVSVRNDAGTEVKTDDEMQASLTRQAFKFIGEA